MRYKHPEKKKLSCLCYSPDSKKILAVYDDGEVMIWKGKQEYPVEYFYREFFTIESLLLATEGKGKRNPVKKVSWISMKWFSLSFVAKLLGERLWHSLGVR